MANKLKSGRTLNEKVDEEVFKTVRMLLEIQHDNAITWRDGTVLCFQTFSHLRNPPIAGLGKRS